MAGPNVLKSEKRIKLYHSKLGDIEEREGAFVIFTHSETGRFIQFGSRDGKPGFIADVPVGGINQLTDEEIAKMRKLGWGERRFGDEIGIMEKVPGIGWEKAVILLKHLDGLDGIASAGEDDLQRVPGIGEESSRRIVTFQPKFRRHISKSRAEKDYSFMKECDLAEAVDLTERFFKDICHLRGDYNVSVESELGETECLICGRVVKDAEVVVPLIFPDKARKLGIPEEKIGKELNSATNLMESAGEPREIVECTRKDGPLFPPICPKCAEEHCLETYG